MKSLFSFLVYVDNKWDYDDNRNMKYIVNDIDISHINYLFSWGGIEEPKYSWEQFPFFKGGIEA